MYKTCSVILYTVAGVIAATAVTACNGPGETTSENASQAIAPNGALGTGGETDSMNLQQQLEYAQKDLARSLGVEPGSITVAGVRTVNWRSGALGCPKPGMSYTDALVPGILILLTVDGVPYGYHATSRGRPFLCPQERVEAPASVQAQDLA